MEIIKNIEVFFLTLTLIGSSWSLGGDGAYKMAVASQQNELSRQETVTSPALSRVKRQFVYEYGVPYYGIYRRPYPLPILIGGGGLVVGRGLGFGGRGFGGRGFGGRGFGGTGFGGTGFGGRGIGGRGGFGGRGGIGGGRGGRG